jgi:hypothetical protein
VIFLSHKLASTEEMIAQRERKAGFTHNEHLELMGPVFDLDRQMQSSAFDTISNGNDACDFSWGLIGTWSDATSFRQYKDAFSGRVQLDLPPGSPVEK